MIVARPRAPRARRPRRRRGTPSAGRSRASRPTSSSTARSEPFRGVFIRAPRVARRRARGRGARRARRRAGARSRGARPRRVVPPGADRRHARPRAVPASSSREETECPGIASGRPSSTRRAPPTRSAASSSRSSRARSSSPRRRAAPTRRQLALQNAIEKARSYSMPKDNIERAIAQRRRARAPTARAFETVVYEGYGPEGVAVLVEALTDNRNRTASDVRHLFTQARRQPRRDRRGRLAVRAARRRARRRRTASTRTSCRWPPPRRGADDVERDGSSVPGLARAGAARRGARRRSRRPASRSSPAELSMVPKTTVAIEDESTAKKVVRLVDALEEQRRRPGRLRELRHPRGACSSRRVLALSARERAPAGARSTRRPAVRPSVPSCREGPRHRPRDGCMRVRDRPRKRRAPQGARATGAGQTRARERAGARLRTIFDGVQELIAEHAPDAVALEESFVGADARIALSVGQARGAVLVAAARRRRVR